MSKDPIKLASEALDIAREALAELPAQESTLSQQAPDPTWQSICETLDSVCPGWTNKGRSGAEAACNTIRELTKPEQELLKKNKMKFNWLPAPRKHEWGAGMVEAVVEIDKDNTFHLFCDEDQVPKVEALFAIAEDPLQQQEPRKPLTDRENSIIRFSVHRFMCHVYQRLDAAAQGKDFGPHAIEAFAKDAKDAEALLAKLPL